MQSSTDLRIKLKRIDHKGYPAYKELKGQYDFGDYVLSIDHVQGDPFAAPSRLSVLVDEKKAGFPRELWDTAPKRITLQDHITRLFGRHLAKASAEGRTGGGSAGSGKSGLLTVSRCGQQVLERTAAHIGQKQIILRFEAGFPAYGRTIHAGELEKMLFVILPDCVRKSLYFKNIDQAKCRQAILLCEDQQAVRRQLSEKGLCAFIGDGAVLPRESGVSEKPMKGAVPFCSPESLRVTMELSGGRRLTGMGVKKGITLFVGGGYHGKSTILQALQNGVYNHIGGDGREFVITDETAVKLRAEDGRSIAHVDISPFIRNLPNGRDTVCFSTEDASGSTSQAANLMEGLESGSSLFLIDEDTSATNFMIRDELMQQVITPGEEPIIPFIDRVESLFRDRGVSTILVAGSSGSYFHVADTIIQMKEYRPLDITEKAKQAALGQPCHKKKEEQFPSYREERCPLPDLALKKQDRIKIKAMGTDGLLLDRESVELRYLEQLKDQEQTEALAYLLKYAELGLMDGRKDFKQILAALEAQLDQKGLESLFEKGDVRASLARPRRQEMLACFGRYRRLRF